MKPHEFRNWRKSQGLKQKEAAELLGLKKRVIQYYEKGKRDGKTVDIPKAVELACFALSAGVQSFDGEESGIVGRPADTVDADQQSEKTEAAE